ncbi:YhcB family protein [Halomonas sp. ATCH28]|uniref:YhcB family protein n=1 Tax=Halomonas gemina TaxID=2945105 RepID=A0ABT0T2E4_9GAMM|nr:YhcB family protein [Halomonas gemina]
MDETNINWVLAIACLLAGIGIGALGYHLLNASAGNTQRLRQRLAERERELAELKDGMGDSLERIARLAESLHRESRGLEQEAEEARDRLGARSLRRQALDAVSPTPAPATATATTEPAMPRDYADGNRGTLAEDFGLKNDVASTPQPPRH